MKIVVVGIGYVGLSNGVLLAQNHCVTLIDLVKSKVDSVNNHISPFADEDISFYLRHKKLNIAATLSQEAYKNADIVIIATPTNYDEKTNCFDTSSVDSVINDILAVNRDCWIVIKSTIPVGYTSSRYNMFKNAKIVFSPEFLREGRALYDNLYPSRIVVGLPNKSDEFIKFANLFIDLLKEGALRNDVESFVMGSTEAESVKLFANTYLALRVAYFNELDSFAISNNLNTSEILRGVCSDRRIGDFYNNPSFGYGGYCLPKDTKELRSDFSNTPQDLISAIVDSNMTRKAFIAQDIKNKFKKKDGTIGIFRLSMKHGSDNFRQSSIQYIVSDLVSSGYKVFVYEPLLKENEWCGCKVIKDLSVFKSTCNLIVTNRFDTNLNDVKDKIYTRDIFTRD